jgi:hypothetical protein
MELKRIDYKRLNARQKENYNYQKVSAVLADYGFVTIRLSDDWNGADFLALHTDGATLKVQLKPRLYVAKNYVGKELWVCFPHGADWYLYPHDEILEESMCQTSIGSTDSWVGEGRYHFNRLSQKMLELLSKYRIADSGTPSLDIE